MKYIDKTMKQNNKLSVEIYQPKKGSPSVKVHFSEDTVWLTQAQIAGLYQSSKVNVTEHIQHIFDENELDKNQLVGISDKFAEKVIVK